MIEQFLDLTEGQSISFLNKKIKKYNNRNKRELKSNNKDKHRA